MLKPMHGAYQICTAVWLGTVLLCEAGNVAQAQTSIPITNSSFEDPDLADGASATGITGWSAVWTGGSPLPALGGVGTYDPLSSQHSEANGNNVMLPGTAHGGQAAFLSIRPGGGRSFVELVSPILATTASGTRYDLTVALGSRFDYAPGTVYIGLAVDQSLAVVQPVDPGNLLAGTFQDFSVSLDVPSGGQALAGKPLQFWLHLEAAPSGPAAVVDFDNLRLMTSVPEPSSYALLLLFGMVWMRQRKAP